MTTSIAAILSFLCLLLFAKPLVLNALKPSWLAAGWGTVAGAFCVLATKLVYPYLASTIPYVQTETVSLYAKLLHPPGLIKALPALVFIVLVEELIWRGVLIEGLQKHLSPVPLALLAAATYTLPQLGSSSWLLAIVAFLFGLTLSKLRIHTQSLSASFCCHITWNLGVFLWFPVENISI